MNDEMEVSRGGENNGGMKATIEAQMQSLYEEAASTPQEELAEPLNWWEIWALGPFQSGAVSIPPAGLGVQPQVPHRIVQVGEQASLYTIVYLNPFWPPTGPSACEILTSFGAYVRLSYRTCNTAICDPGGPPELNRDYEIELNPNQCWYVHEVEFTPREAACLLETNVCAVVLNCREPRQPVRPFAAFVRWVYNLDTDLFFGAERWGFDRPIRFMVSDF